MKKFSFLFLGIGVLLCSTFTAAQFPRIQLSLNVHDNSHVKFYRQLCWGLDPTATMGRDASLANVICGTDTGELEFPPWPPDAPEVRWVGPTSNTGVLGNGTLLDLRQFYSHTQVDTYRVRIQDSVGGFPVTLSWPRVLVHDYYGCSVRLVIGLSTEIDMRAQDSLTITDPDIQYLLLIASCPLGSNSISGTVFQDMEGDGAKGTGDPPLSGWKVRLSGAKVDSVNSDASGNYTFTNLPNGLYTVSEEVQSGWLQTAPAGGSYSIPLADGQAEADVNFGNFQYATLRGIKFDDANGNGIYNEGETRLSEWRIILNGVAAETTITDGVGHFSFTHVGPGEYSIRERQDRCRMPQVVADADERDAREQHPVAVREAHQQVRRRRPSSQAKSTSRSASCRTWKRASTSRFCSSRTSCVWSRSAIRACVRNRASRRSSLKGTSS